MRTNLTSVPPTQGYFAYIKCNPTMIDYKARKGVAGKRFQNENWALKTGKTEFYNCNICIFTYNKMSSDTLKEGIPMLKQLRNKKTAKKIWIALAAIILPAFIFWGSGSIMREEKKSNSAGTLFGRGISLAEFRDAIAGVQNQMIMQFGDNFSEMQKYINLQDKAWERIVLLQEARKRRLKVGDNEVIKRIETYPLFQRKGVFDNELYTRMLRSYFHANPRVFEEQVRQNLLISKLFEVITADVTVSDQEIKAGYRKENEQISIDYVNADTSALAKDMSVSDEELNGYFEKNRLQFKQPLSFNIEYATVETQEKIEEVYGKFRKDFDKAAQELNLKVQESGLFVQTDPIPGIGWSPQILTLLSQLKPGQVAPPVQSDNTFYFLRLKERKEPYIPGLEAIKEKVKDAFTKEKSLTLAQERMEACRKELNESADNNTADIGKAAQKYGLKHSSTELFKFGSYLEGIGASDILWLAATGTKEGFFSEILTMPSGLYAVRLKSKVGIDEQKFAEEKEEFSQRILEQKKMETFNSYILNLKRKSQLF